MKGSAGWVVLGILVVFFIFLFVRIFYLDAVSYKLKHQSIVLGELELLNAKNTILLAEKSLDVTWNLSSLRQIFDAGQNGFGSEFWHRIKAADKSQTGKVPGNGDVKAYLESLSKSYKGYSGFEDTGNVRLHTRAVPAFTLEDSKITVRVLGTIKTSAGDEKNPRTESPKSVDRTYSFSVQFKRLMDVGKLFAQAAARATIPQFASDRSAYIKAAENSISNQFNSVATDLDKKITLEDSRLFVSTENEKGVLAPLSGLLFNYLIRADFTEKQSLYRYLGETFNKKPFSLTVKAEDYLVALNCAQNSGKLFAFTSPNDMACDAGQIFTCSTIIDGIRNNLLSCQNGIGQRTAGGTFGCGENRFKTASAVDETPCYCTAFGGSWIGGESWTCTDTTTVCKKVKEGEKEVERCEPVTTSRTKSCPRECDLNGRFCTPNVC